MMLWEVREEARDAISRISKNTDEVARDFRYLQELAIEYPEFKSIFEDFDDLTEECANDMDYICFKTSAAYDEIEKIETEN